MARISGVDLPNNKQIRIALTYIYGIGHSLAKEICEKVNLDGMKKSADLTQEEVSSLRKIIENDYRVEGELRSEVSLNIKRLIDIGSYRGIRHRSSLPVRGQNTKNNARTRKGRKKTVANKKK